MLSTYIVETGQPIATFVDQPVATTKESTTTSQLQYTTPTSAPPRAAAEDTAIRPFRNRVSEAELVELRRRIMATRWPEKETVADLSQGVPLEMLRELARHWATDYDWRKCEAKLNAVPQFVLWYGLTGLNEHHYAPRQHLVDADGQADSAHPWPILFHETLPAVREFLAANEVPVSFEQIYVGRAPSCLRAQTTSPRRCTAPR